MGTSEDYISKVLPRAGVNKRRELARLLHEISRRDHLTFEQILPLEKNLDFEKAKKILLQKRYPKNFGRVPLSSFYLPKMDNAVCAPADLSGAAFEPKNIFIDEGVKESKVARNALKLFPKATATVLDKKTAVGKSDYSQRAETLYITEEKYDFVKSCPCTAGAAGCGYNLVNLGFGCVYECAYCFLQQYANRHAIVLPANIDGFLAKIDLMKPAKGPFDRPRIGSGEFTDSLVFDHITGYSADIINFFRNRPHLDFEFKTKSVNINGILATPPAENIVVAWSVNTPYIIKTVEFLTPDLRQRLAAAKEIVKAGYRTAFHFDPVIIYDGWKADYRQTIEEIAAAVDPAKISWISVGTLRFNRELKKIIEARHCNADMLLEEFLLGFDGKMRYADWQRKEVYDFMLPLLHKYFPKAKVYLCMEKVQ